VIFSETRLAGAFTVDPEPIADERGFFARTFCSEAFAAHGLCSTFVQCNVSFNHRRGTLRGMHYQAAPFAEAKLVRCTMGAIHDVIVDRDHPWKIRIVTSHRFHHPSCWRYRGPRISSPGRAPVGSP
jgi:dTDP-4-dehydrorhamnose 3,5-epimerase-like enzyme